MPALRRCAIALGFIVLIVARCVISSAADQPKKDVKQPVFRAAAATSVITPAIGGDIIGGFSPAPSRHIHDELNARCLVLDDGKTKVALVV